MIVMGWNSLECQKKRQKLLGRLEFLLMIECLLWDVVALVTDGLKSERLLKMQKLGDGTYP